MSSKILYFEFLLSLFVLSLFLLLGADKPSQLYPRMVAGGLLLGVSLFPLWRGHLRGAEKNPAALALFSFFVFILARFLMAAVRRGIGGSPEDPVLLSNFLSSPLRWAFFAGFFALSFGFLSERGRVERFLWLLSWCGFLLAACAFPPLLIRGDMGYLVPEGIYWFFPPFFYFHPVLTQYVFGTWTHVNFLGDLVALGFFPALGLLIYRFHHAEKGKGRFSIVSLVLPACLAGASVLAVTLIMSRGTMVSFGIALSFFLGVYTLKFLSRRKVFTVGGVIVLILGFLLAGGHLVKVWNELRTIRGDVKGKTASSFAETKEGIRRALRIYRDHPLWGVGTRGYRQVAEEYATAGTKEPFFNARVRAMCHYAHLLAEEGAGAFLYFIFLLAYGFEVFRGLRRVKSRFQFLAGLSLFSGVLTLLIHGSIHYLLQQFSISLLLYILMGASLGALQGSSLDIRHSSSPSPGIDK